MVLVYYRYTLKDKLDAVFDETLDVYLPALVDRWMPYVAHTNFAATC